VRHGFSGGKTMKGQQLFDHQKININLARLKTHGTNFELVVDPDMAISFKEGKEVDIVDILKAQEIFSDANKGLLSSEDEVEKVFGTKNVLEVAKKILNDGDIQLTADHREKVRNKKKKRIINIIHINAIEPKTGMPHPIQRIEAAMNEVNVHIDEFKRAEDQISDIVKKLIVVLPIRFAKKEIQVSIPAEYAQKTYGKIQKFGIIKKEEWLNDGSWLAVIEIPAGLQNEFFDELNKETHGNVDTKIVNER